MMYWVIQILYMSLKECTLYYCSRKYCTVLYSILHTLYMNILWVRLNIHSNFYQNVDFQSMNFNEIEFWSTINNQTDNSKFFINFLDTWSWLEIILYFLDFQIYLFTIIYSSVTFIHQRGDLCGIIIFSFTVFVQFGVSVFMRKSIK